MIGIQETKIKFISDDDIKKAEQLLMKEIEKKRDSLIADMENLKNVIRSTIPNINIQ